MKKILFHKSYIGKEEIIAATDSLKSGWITMGPKTIKFEKLFSNYILKNSKYKFEKESNPFYSVSCNSATAALHLALKAINLKKNDEVIIPTNTFVATAEVVGYFGAKPVLCDVEYETHNIDCSKIQDLITSKTKAIIPVHYGGQPCDMDKILHIAKKRKIKVIEDAAHALPSSYKKQIIGSIADITCFSFYATKTLSTGEGGMAVTKNLKFAKSMRLNRLHGISKDAWKRYTDKGNWFYEVVDNGYKYNTTDINAAIGIVQLNRLPWLQQKRKKIAQKYNEAFKKIDSVKTLKIKNDRSTSWHLYGIKVSNRNKFIDILKRENVQLSVHYIPIHMHSYYKKKYNYRHSDYPVANKIYKETVSLPIYPGLSDKEVNYIIKKVIKYA
jgi:dTDP-4-amino-4,6-dideoxygalactose transaminase